MELEGRMWMSWRRRWCNGEPDMICNHIMWEEGEERPEKVTSPL